MKVRSGGKVHFDYVIAYRQAIGIVDLKALDRFMKTNDVDKLLLIAENPLTQGTINYLNDLSWKEKVEVVVTDRLLKTVSELKKKYREKEIKVINLDEFGERPFQYDSC